jgi:hypothetical protein
VLAAPSIDAALRRFLDFPIATVTDVDSDDVTRGCLTTNTATDETVMEDAIRAALHGVADDLLRLL